MADLSALEGSEPTPSYVGLVTRLIAFVLDAAVINAIAILAEAGIALILSLFHLPKDLKTVIAALGGTAYVLWTIAYFVTFWSTTGQTPGARVMQIRVVTAGGGQLKPRLGIRRCIGMLLAALPLFAGYVLVLFDDRRRGLHDRLAGTVVVEVPQLSVVEVRRAAMRAAYDSRRRRPPAVSA